MENDENRELRGETRMRHLRVVIIALTVNILSIPRILNNLSSYEAAYDPDDWEAMIPIQRSTQMSYVAAGILAYALFAFLFQRFSRKTCLYCACVAQLAASAVQLCGNSLWLLHLSKAFSAVSDVGAEMFCVIYVSEIAPDEIRGALVGIQQLTFSLIEFLSLFMFLTEDVLKPLHYACISIALSAIVAILTFAAVPESPIYFLRRDDMEGAKKSLTFLNGSDKNVTQVIDNRKKILKATRSDSEISTSLFRECISRRSVKFIGIIIVVYFSRIIAGYLLSNLYVANANWWIPRIQSHHVIFLFIKGFATVLSILLGLVLCDRVGRKILILISIFVCSVLLIVCGIILYLDKLYDVLSQTGILSEVLLVTYSIGFNLGTIFLPEVLITDIFPPKILNTLMAIFGSFHLCFCFVIYYPPYEPQHSPITMYGELWLFGGLLFTAALLMIKFLPETKCRPPGFKFVDTEERVFFSSLRDEE